MKKILITLFLIISFVSNGQMVDTLQLSPKELFEFNSEFNNLGLLQSYVDFQKDVLSTSNLSFGFIGKQVSTTLNLGYNKQSLNGKWGHTYSASLNPMWNYYGVGYGFSKRNDIRTTTLQTFIASDFDFQKDFTISFIDVIKTKKWGTLGYSFIATKSFWGEYEGEWEGKFIVDENGEWVKNIYPIEPASSATTYRAMLMYTYTFKTKRVNISPQIFTMSDVLSYYKDGGVSDLTYFNDFNLDSYYGLSLDWKITKRFVLNTNIRFNHTIDVLDKEIGYKKENPIILMVGTNFAF